jgi:hypothetical protein
VKGTDSGIGKDKGKRRSGGEMREDQKGRNEDG